ncbi:hypothetical protein CcCBS67573_g07402 [Chytriomyces confervae]|uniref:Uncharacterized protein n=1 Tax=Chytriomyces confervae TaxID=246404 RepID=A0A507EX49_9FUNG|nr:hypothetical protein CcCBS67573_g07402 [Chytriomyces confervae]
MFVPAVLVAFLATVSHALHDSFLVKRACQPDVLVDDFRPRTPSMYRQQPLQILQGGVLTPTYCDQAQDLNAINARLEDAARPNSSDTINYWFTKFNWENDFDLTVYSGFEMEMIAPAGSDFNITLTQWLPASNSRGIDSKYRLLSSYITPNGKPQTLRIMWTDFSTNLLGQPFDLVHLKDLTLVNLAPIGAVFTFTKLKLLGTCINSPSAVAGSVGTVSTGAGVPVATAGATSGSSGASPAAAGAAKSGASRSSSGLLAVVSVVMYLLC